VLSEYDLNAEADINVNVKADDKTFIITLSGKLKNSEENEFKEWCNNLDEDLFLEACDKFEDYTGKSLNNIGNDYESFKKVVHKIITDKIAKLESYL
jgi:hypothetical protein